MELAGVIKEFMIKIFISMILLWGLIPFTVFAQPVLLQVRVAAVSAVDTDVQAVLAARNACNAALLSPNTSVSGSLANVSGQMSATLDLILPAGTGPKIVCAARFYTASNQPAGPVQYQTVTLTGQTSVSTPTPTPTPTLTPTATPVTTNCVCQGDGFCSSTCTFERHATGVSYNSQIKCRPNNNIIYGNNNPAPDNFCQRNLRTKGDADGISGVDILDYVYWLRASRGARIPPSVNPDFNGDGVIDDTDRDIWKRSLP